MLRFIRSLIFGLLIGALVGLYFGWIQFPTNARSSSLSDMAQHYRDEYSVMVAAGYAADADLAGAIERLSRLDIDDVPTYFRESTERIINTSSRDLDDIGLLAQLADGLGQLTLTMQPFLDVNGERA